MTPAQLLATLLSFRKWIGVGLLIFLIILSGCSVGDNPVPHDWCYFFNFDTGDYGVGTVYGQWEVIDGIGGMTTDEQGRLSFSYTHDQVVSPTAVIITAARASGVLGDIGVSANGLIFGIGTGDSGFNGILLANQVSADISFLPDFAGASGTTFNITLQATPAASTMQIRRLEIQGTGAVPFDVNNCDPFQSTPTPNEPATDTQTPSPTFPITLTPSDTPTHTPTYTDTPTASNTPTATATATPTGNWCQIAIIDFDGRSDVPWDSGGYNPRLVPGFDGLGQSGGSVSSGTNPVFYYNGFYFDGDSDGAFHFEVDPAWNVKYWTFWTKYQPAPVDDLGKTFLWYTQANGTGLLSGAVQIATSNGWIQYKMSFNGDNGTTGYSDFYFDFAWTAHNQVDVTIDELTLCYDGTPFTQTPTITPTPSNTRTATATRTPTITNTPASNPTATLTPNPLTPGSGSGTPTSTRTPSRTPVVIASRTATMTLTPLTVTVTPEPGSATPLPSLVPLPTAVATGEAGDTIGDLINEVGGFFNWIINSFLNFWDWLRSLVYWLGGTLGNFGILIGNIWQAFLGFIQLVLGFISLAFSIIGLIIAIILHLISLFVAWIVQVVNTASMIVGSWYNTPPQAIPFLPQCATHPMDSQVCAFYYVMTYTFFSGSVGTLLVPVMLILVDLNTIFYFIYTVRNFVKKVEGITE